MNEKEIERLTEQLSAAEDALRDALEKKKLESVSNDTIEISIGYTELPTTLRINDVETRTIKVQHMSDLKTKVFGIVKNYPGAKITVKSHLPEELVRILNENNIPCEVV